MFVGLLFVLLFVGTRIPHVAADCYLPCGPASASYAFSECAEVPMTGELYNYTYQGDTSLLTNGFDPVSIPCSPSSSSNDYRLRFRPKFTSLFSLDTDGSQFDTVMSILDCRTGQLLRCDDDSGEETRSQISIRLEKDVDYLIVVDGYSRDSQGPFKLRLASIFWPTVDTCPGVDRIEQFGDLTPNVPRRIYAASMQTRLMQMLNTSYCGDWLNATDPGNATLLLDTRTEVVGVVAPETGTYDLLVCPPVVQVSPFVCRDRPPVNESELNSTETDSISYKTCADATPSVFLNQGEYLSLASLNTNAIRSTTQADHVVYATLNRTNGSFNLCSECRPLIVQTSSSNRPGRGEYVVSESINPLTHEPYIGNHFFFNPASTGTIRLSVCGSVNGDAFIKTCDGTVIASSVVGKTLSVNVTGRQLYALQVVGYTPRDKGLMSVEIAGSSVRDDCVEEAVRNVPGRPGFSGEVAIASFFTGMFGVVMLGCLGTLVAYGSHKEYMQTGLIIALVFSTIGFVSSLAVSVALAHAVPAPSLGFIQLYWVIIAMLGYMALFIKYLGGYEWRILTGPAIFFYDNESAVKVRFGWGIVALCTFLAMAVAAFSSFVQSQLVEAADFSFCSLENEPCYAPLTGTLIQRVISVRMIVADGQGNVLSEEYLKQIEYDYVNLNKQENKTHYMCSLQPDEVEVSSVQLCANTCAGYTRNGVCNERTFCNYGNDCADCGVRYSNTTRRVVRCNKWDRIAVYWSGQSGLVQHTVLPFIYALLISLTFSAAVVVFGSACAEKPRSISESSEENSQEGENNNPEDVAVIRLQEREGMPFDFA